MFSRYFELGLFYLLVVLWMYVCSVAQSFPTLCDPLDCNPPGSSVYEIFQVRTCISCLLHWLVGSLLLCHLGSIKSMSLNVSVWVYKTQASLVAWFVKNPPAIQETQV